MKYGLLLVCMGIFSPLFGGSCSSKKNYSAIKEPKRAMPGDSPLSQEALKKLAALREGLKNGTLEFKPTRPKTPPAQPHKGVHIFNWR